MTIREQMKADQEAMRKRLAAHYQRIDAMPKRTRQDFTLHTHRGPITVTAFTESEAWDKARARGCFKPGEDPDLHRKCQICGATIKNCCC